MDTKEHWNAVYSNKQDSDLSWTQPDPALSLSLIREACTAGHVMDVGGGASLLAERMLASGYRVSVLDISEAALERARARMGARSQQVTWIVADVTATPALELVDIWHDRAVFHFLTDESHRRAYVSLLARTLKPGGHAVMATFALDGPEKCSGLPVQRYDARLLAEELGAGFQLVKSTAETHLTPWGKPQSFQYAVFRRL